METAGITDESSPPSVDDLHARLRPRREIYGASAVLLPYREAAVDWEGFERLLGDTVEAGLVPAVNMDTGYANLIDEATRDEVLRRTAAATQVFVGGAFVSDESGASFDLDAYKHNAGAVREAGGMPILFQSHGLTSQRDEDLVAAYDAIGQAVGSFLAFELGTMFAPFGRIYSLAEYRGLLELSTCVGAKHSSLRRHDEWQRLALRDAVRPEFRVLTGNDLAIDLVMYGSDYLLGLSAFHPAAFSARDRLWATGDSRFYEVNDWLQALGMFAFRDPVPAYKHSAAQFLALRGRITSDETHPHSVPRLQSDVEILASLLDGLRACLEDLPPELRSAAA